MDTAKRSHNTAESRKPTLSIRARLVILALLAVVPLMFDRVRLLEQTRAERIDDAAAEALELARRGVQGQREIVTAAKSMLQVMARSYIGMLATGTTCNFYLSDLATGMPWINGITVLGADGRIKCSTNPDSVGIDMSDRPHIRAAMETREFTISDYIVGRVNRKPIFAAVFPTQAIDPTVQAVIMTSIDLQWVTGVIASLERRSGASVLLIDREGTVVAGNAVGNDGIGKRINDTAFFKSLGGAEEGTVRGEGPDGIRRIYGYARVPLSDARLVVGLNEAEVLHRTDREILLAYLQLGFFGLLVLLMAWFGGERLIVAPIRSLARPRSASDAAICRRAPRARPGPRSSPRSPPRSTTWRGNSPIASRSCATPTATSKRSHRATRCRVSPTGAASMRGWPPTGSDPASSIGRSRCS